MRLKRIENIFFLCCIHEIRPDTQDLMPFIFYQAGNKSLLFCFILFIFFDDNKLIWAVWRLFSFSFVFCFWFCFDRAQKPKNCSVQCLIESIGWNKKLVCCWLILFFWIERAKAFKRECSHLTNLSNYVYFKRHASTLMCLMQGFCRFRLSIEELL